MANNLGFEFELEGIFSLSFVLKCRSDFWFVEICISCLLREFSVKTLSLFVTGEVVGLIGFTVVVEILMGGLLDVSKGSFEMSGIPKSALAIEICKIKLNLIF